MAKKELTLADLKEIEEKNKAEAAAQAGNSRVYAGNMELDHDLFKLEVAPMMKDLSWSDIPNYVQVEHCHFYHTIDSSGRKLLESSSVGGHFHEMFLTEQQGKAPSVVCGPPVKYVLKKVAGRWKKVTEQIKADSHVHNVKYVSSEKVQLRKMNAEYLKVQSAIDAASPKSVEGVI